MVLEDALEEGLQLGAPEVSQHLLPLGRVLAARERGGAVRRRSVRQRDKHGFVETQREENERKMTKRAFRCFRGTSFK